MLNGLSVINVELTNRCNKDCWMCGRRKREKENPSIVDTYGDMNLALVEKIAKQLPAGIIVQLHNNGEPLLYPLLCEAIGAFKHQITHLDTNGKLLLGRFNDLLYLDVITISVIENDPEADEQLRIIKEFLHRMKEYPNPKVVLRLNGQVDSSRYQELNVPIVKRILHAPEGSFDYRRRQPTKPEHGICTEILNHPAINKDGDFSICVRYDPHRLGVLGNVNDCSIEDLWQSEKRLQWVQDHVEFNRYGAPLCIGCEYWGVATGE